MHMEVIHLQIHFIKWCRLLAGLLACLIHTKKLFAHFKTICERNLWLLDGDYVKSLCYSYLNNMQRDTTTTTTTKQFYRNGMKRSRLLNNNGWNNNNIGLCCFFFFYLFFVFVDSLKCSFWNILNLVTNRCAMWEVILDVIAKQNERKTQNK